MFKDYTDWTQMPCYYVIATTGMRRAWLAGPYPTYDAADAALPAAQLWALTRSTNDCSPDYQYTVTIHHNGETRSILGGPVR